MQCICLKAITLQKGLQCVLSEDYYSLRHSGSWESWFIGCTKPLKAPPWISHDSLWRLTMLRQKPLDIIGGSQHHFILFGIRFTKPLKAPPWISHDSLWRLTMLRLKPLNMMEEGVSTKLVFWAKIETQNIVFCDVMSKSKRNKNMSSMKSMPKMFVQIETIK